MTNKTKYDQAFIDSFSLTPADLNDKLVYESVPEWDFRWAYGVNV